MMQLPATRCNGFNFQDICNFCMCIGFVRKATVTFNPKSVTLWRHSTVTLSSCIAWDETNSESDLITAKKLYIEGHEHDA